MEECRTVCPGSDCMKSRLSWCAGAKNGIMLTAPNADLASAYLRKAEDAMEAMHSVESRDWKISAGYYSLYFSLYSVLMKTGIKSENHVCTVGIMQHLFSEYFTREECDLLEMARQARVRTQYYTTSDVTATFFRHPGKRGSPFPREMPGNR